MDTKDFAVSVKAGPGDGLEDGQFLAYAAVFGNIDSDGDVIVKGAFEADLNRWAGSPSNLPVLFGHDMKDPFSNLGFAVEAVEDDHGLLVKGQLDLENPKAAQVYRMLKGRRINNLSFAYTILDQGPTVVNGQKANELRLLRVHEISIVPIGANQETEILAVKANADALADGVKAGRTISAKNESELRKAYDSIGVVLSSLGNVDEEKASGQAAVKDEEPVVVKSEEPSVTPSAKTLIAELTLLSLIEAEGDLS